MKQQCIGMFVLINFFPTIVSPHPFNPNQNQQSEVNPEPTFRFFGAASTVTVATTVTQLQTLLAAKSCVMYLPGLTPCPASLVAGPQGVVGRPQLAQIQPAPGVGIGAGPLLPPGGPAVVKPGFPNMLPGFPNLLPGFPNLLPPFPNIFPPLPNVLPGLPNLPFKLFDAPANAPNPQFQASRALDGVTSLGGVDAIGDRGERKVLTLNLSPSAQLIVETTEPPESAFSGRTEFQIQNSVEPSMDSRSGGVLEEFEIIGMPAECIAQQRNLLPNQVGIVKIVTTTSTVVSLTTSFFPGGVDPKATATFVVAGCIPVNPPLNFPPCLVNIAP